MHQRVEIERWAKTKDGVRVWRKCRSGGWTLEAYPKWKPDETYIVNDEYASIRKSAVDGATVQTRVSFMSDTSVSYGDEVEWNTKFDANYILSKFSVPVEHFRVFNEYQKFEDAVEDGKDIEYLNGFDEWCRLESSCMTMYEYDVDCLRITENAEYEWQWRYVIDGKEYVTPDRLTSNEALALMRRTEGAYLGERVNKRLREEKC